MDKPDVQAVLGKLDVIIRLLVLSLAEGKKQKEQFLLLSRAGFLPKHIAEMLGTTPNTVRVVLSHLRKEKTRKPRPKEEGDK